MGLDAQVRGGPTEGEHRPAPRTAGSRARRPERRAQAGEGEAAASEKENEKEEKDRGAPAARRTHLGSGRPPRARASSRSLGPSCPSPCLCLLCAPTSRPRSARSARTAPGGGDARQVWSKGWDRLWEKFVPRGRGAEAGRTTGRAAARALRGGRLLSPAGSAGTRRAVRATWDWRSLRPAVALALGAAPVAQGSARFPPLSAPVAASVRRARSPRRERQSPSGQRLRRPAAAVTPLLPSARARSFDKLGGTPRRLFFNCPTANHLPPAGWTLAPPSRPPLASPPPSSPPHPHPEARTRHREEPGLGAHGRSPFPSPSRPGRGAVRWAAAGHPRQGSLEAARSSSRRRRARGSRTTRPGEIPRPRKGSGPGALAPRSSLRFPARQRPGGLVPSLQRGENGGDKCCSSDTCPAKLRPWNPWEGEKRLLFSHESLGFRPFFSEKPHTHVGQR